MGRDEVQLSVNDHPICGGKRIMVTGGGVHRFRLCRQIASRRPETLIIVDIYRTALTTIQQELRRKYGSEFQLMCWIAPVRIQKK